MAAGADLARLLRVAPPRTQPCLEKRPAAPLRDVRLGEKTALRLTRRGRERGDLRAEPDAAGRREVRADADLGQPEPEVARAGELGEADAGER